VESGQASDTYERDGGVKRGGRHRSPDHAARAVARNRAQSGLRSAVGGHQARPGDGGSPSARASPVARHRAGGSTIVTVTLSAGS
jgi:hypothetical protein